MRRISGCTSVWRRASRWARRSRACFEAVAEEHLTQPTIIYEFPTAVSPLSKQKPDEPEWTERFEIYAGQMEISNGFSELERSGGSAAAV
jgi:lysyl-tRNA synthetase class 2